jgi:hypothetical protein
VSSPGRHLARWSGPPPQRGPANHVLVFVHAVVADRTTGLCPAQRVVQTALIAGFEKDVRVGVERERLRAPELCDQDHPPCYSRRHPQPKSVKLTAFPPK